MTSETTQGRHDRRVVEIVYALLVSGLVAAAPAGIVRVWAEQSPSTVSGSVTAAAHWLSRGLAVAGIAWIAWTLVSFERRLRREFSPPARGRG